MVSYKALNTEQKQKIEANQFYLDYLCGYINCYSII